MDDRPKDDTGQASPAPERAPYVTPEIAWEDELGTRPGLVAVCGKAAGQSPSCNSNAAS
jgi:hypothetical protein